MGVSSFEKLWGEDQFQWDLTQRGNSRCTVNYLVKTSLGTETESEITDYIALNCPEYYAGNIPRKRISISERLTENLWKVEVEYAFDSTNRGDANKDPDDPIPVNDSAYGFEISTETRKMVYSFGLKQRFPAGAPTPQAGIRDGEGIDTIMPVAHFTETHKLLLCDAAYRKKVASLVGKINDGVFRGYGRGEVLFIGASGSKDGDNSWNITFKFATAENQSGLTIGTITGVSKDAWDCIWVKSRDVNVQGVGLIRQAQYVYTEQVYEYDDFGKLGI